MIVSLLPKLIGQQLTCSCTPLPDSLECIYVISTLVREWRCSWIPEYVTQYFFIEQWHRVLTSRCRSCVSWRQQCSLVRWGDNTVLICTARDSSRGERSVATGFLREDEPELSSAFCPLHPLLSAEQKDTQPLGAGRKQRHSLNVLCGFYIEVEGNGYLNAWC